MIISGKYGHLPPIKAAQEILMEIAVDWKDQPYPFTFKQTLSNAEQYENNRLCKLVEGLQKVIYLNGGEQPHTWLPMLYKPKK